MKGFLKNAVLFVGIIAIVASCSSAKKVIVNPVEYGTIMKTEFSITVNQHQLDSICVADGLCIDLDEWVYEPYQDYETGNTICKRTFVKSAEADKEEIYILTGCQAPYKLSKRITK